MATSNNINTFNEFVGKADMKCKQCFLNLTLDDYPVIPTIEFNVLTVKIVFYG